MEIILWIAGYVAIGLIVGMFFWFLDPPKTDTDETLHGLAGLAWPVTLPGYLLALIVVMLATAIKSLYTRFTRGHL